MAEVTRRRATRTAGGGREAAGRDDETTSDKPTRRRRDKPKLTRFKEKRKIKKTAAMDSEPKKPEVNKNESGEERWIDKMAKRIMAYDSCQIREKQILKFLIDWLHVTILNEEGKRNVSKLLEALDTLYYHYDAMKIIMLKAENYDEDCMVNEKYGISRRKYIVLSEDSDDNNDDYDEDDDDGGDDMEVDFMSGEVRKSGGGKA
jgi:hypothetical protein